MLSIPTRTLSLKYIGKRYRAKAESIPQVVLFVVNSPSILNGHNTTCKKVVSCWTGMPTRYNYELRDPDGLEYVLQKINEEEEREESSRQHPIKR